MKVVKRSNLDQVRASVDAKLAALARKRGVECCMRTYGDECASRDGIPASRMAEERRRSNLEECVNRKMERSVSLGKWGALFGAASVCGSVPRKAASRRACCECDAETLAASKVPSPLPHIPDLTAENPSFAARLIIAVRDRFGGDAPKVYNAAGVTRQAYSQIVSDETRAVSKRTAMRFAFALRCTADEARDLLKSAGFAFSQSQTEDFILQACLEANPPIYDFETINKLLIEYRVDYQY